MSYNNEQNRAVISHFESNSVIIDSGTHMNMYNWPFMTANVPKKSDTLYVGKSACIAIVNLNTE